MRMNSIATKAIRIAVTTCPLPRSLSTPNTDMGATAESHDAVENQVSSVRVRAGEVPRFVVLASVLKHLSFSPGGSRREREPRRASDFSARQG